MIQSTQRKIAQFASKGVLLDSNLALLLLIGSMDKTLIGNHKRVRQYTSDDFDLLNAILQPVSRLLTTPHIATEVSNLAGNLSSDQRFISLLRCFFEKAPESHCPASTVVKLDRWEKLGLTDTALCFLGRRRLVLTDDLQLALSLERGGENVINFNHLRSFG